VAGILDGDQLAPGVHERSHHEAEPVGEPVADHHVVGVGAHAPHPTEVVGHRVPELREAAGIGVAELRAGQRLQRGAGEQVEVGKPRREVDDHPAVVDAGPAGHRAGAAGRVDDGRVDDRPEPGRDAR
jgi:hypothetical protein